MTILLAYVPRPEGHTALEKSIALAKERNEYLIVVNVSAGGVGEDSSHADPQDVERVEQLLSVSGIRFEFKQYSGDQNPIDVLENLVASQQVSMLVIGLRKRSALGKMIMGSMAHDILMTISCPILTVKAD
jgi:nucleotide-binding universal stress UspA family protein